MTPFGLYLESLRRSRQLQQVQLADHLGVNACYVSAMENGKKGPPSQQVLSKLIASLKLDAEEQETLWDKVDESQRTIRLPDNATLEEYALMRDLRRHLGALSSDKVNVIRNILNMDVRPKSGVEIRSI
ncbi:helix-turn-helix domain-containing protein [Vibrio mimicus]|uniref:helix-turn-helix domain-containing protein n=1 Tax=Vibrio mimicus TaxID=674 RepID=UPI0011DB802B|nr:helix-turn-helix transcriptional regulator [Vibrio mimicus]EGQ9436941.1 helix-turn-helix transcriptional regulator [Vibrio cholerae]EHP5029875.1 helix-turn-helix domain-containing protein [Vibrio cholerae]TXY48268.1 helix-turn-helix transcriptional regulator [Vibrio mimicus]HDI3233631.1 helix-turn-helix domain-containing protein [Vibrio cholerae]HDI3271066.1 helix-turn-helix domain-containing protein [Vibrio cholerae]